jgi:hypothetical protein
MTRPAKLPTVQESEVQQNQKFEERLRIAEHLVGVLREAGYSCELDDEDGLKSAFLPLPPH